MQKSTSISTVKNAIVFAIVGLLFNFIDAAAEPVKFEFTGLVDQAGGGFDFIPPGSNVIGTLTIDFDKAQNPNCDTPPVPFPWDGCSVRGGPAWDQPPIVDHSEHVVTFEITVLDQFTYRSIDYPVGQWNSYSTVNAREVTIDDQDIYSWTAQEDQTEVEPAVPATNDNNSGAYIFVHSPSELPFTETGYPVFADDTTGFGRFGGRRDGPGTGGAVLFTLTSLTPLDPVPVFTPRPPPSGDSGGGGGGAIATGTLFILLGFSIMQLCRCRTLKRKK